MTPHAINSKWNPFIRSQNYFVFYKSMILTKPGTYVKGYANYYTCIKFESSSIKNDLRNVEMVQITN